MRPSASKAASGLYRVTLAGLEGQRKRGDSWQVPFERLLRTCRVRQQRHPWQRLDDFRVGRTADQAGRVRQQIATVISRFAGTVAMRVGRYLKAFEFRDEPRNRIVQPDFALLEKHQNGDARNRLRHGGDAKQRVGGDWLFGLDVELAERFEVRNTAAPRDEGHGARDLSRLDLALHRFADAAEALAREADFLRLRARRRGRDRPGKQDQNGAGQRERRLRARFRTWNIGSSLCSREAQRVSVAELIERRRGQRASAPAAR